MPSPVPAPRSLRRELGQLSWWAREYQKPGRLLLQRRVNRALTGAPLPRRRRVPGSVWGVSVVRDEADIIELVVRHQLAQGLDRVLIADNGSVDGTWELLQGLAAEDGRVHLYRDAWPRHDQSEKISRLARLAGWAGADWIVPFDADEFWFAREASVADALRSLALRYDDLGVVHAHWYTAIPMEAVGVEAPFVVDAQAVFPGKVAVRSHPLVTIWQGNHTAARVGREITADLHIAHALYRSAAQIARKVRQGYRAEQASSHPMAMHWEYGSQLSDVEVQATWDDMRAGRPVPKLDVPSNRPILGLPVLTWRTWDPDSRLG